MLLKFIILALVAVAVAHEAEEEKYSTNNENSDVKSRDALLDKIFTGYKTENYPENTTVQFGLSVNNVDFDDEHGILTSNVWIKKIWTDSRLTWDAKKEGINILRVPPSKVWLPDTTIYNGPDQTMSCAPTNVLIYSTGMVLWVPPCNIKSYCNFTLSSDPYGVQECNMKFGSWTFDGITMGLDFYKNESKVDISDFVAGNRFKITKNVAVREEKFYPCCKEPYVSIDYKLGIQKLPKTQHICPKA